MASRTAKRKVTSDTPAFQRPRQNEHCVVLTDGRAKSVDASFLLGASSARDPWTQIARLGEQFLKINQEAFRAIDLVADLQARPDSVRLHVKTGAMVGSVPLVSPTTGKPDYGLVIQPRHGWAGIGPMMGAMGWRVLPALLRLPQVPGTERNVPSWVLASTFLFRIEALLARLDRRFELIQQDRNIPRGRVHWNQYSARIAKGSFLTIPSTAPDLRDDRELKGVIKYALQKIKASLVTQLQTGVVVSQLLELTHRLLEKVQGVAPIMNAAPILAKDGRRKALSEPGGWYQQGLEAIEWTIEERGLAGLVLTEGLPWRMSMAEFFEAWVETFIRTVAKRTGGIVRSGRQRETMIPLSWDPPYRGSQGHLLPDVVLDRGDEVLVFDAKYKDHWEELQFDPYRDLSEQIRETHRHDLLQVLAYSTVFTAPKVKAVLVYPCKKSTWESLKERSQLVNRASIYRGEKKLELLLLAAPMGGDVGTLAEQYAEVLR